MRCPQCTTDIGEAGHCACGWKLHEQHRDVKPIPLRCQHPGCDGDAVHRVRIERRHMLDVCDKHYVWAATKHLMGHHA